MAQHGWSSGLACRHHETFVFRGFIEDQTAHTVVAKTLQEMTAQK
jgi:hypothetical protein